MTGSDLSLQSMDAKWPVGKKWAWLTCALAFFLGMFDLADRMVLAALFPYLKAEYALTDTQLGSLMSVVNLSIALLVVPSGYLIDRWSRKKMICLMGVIWSVATGACAFAASFTHLLVARFVVGAGEAGYNPAAQSLMAASFPIRFRATAVGLAQVGMMLGGPLGLVVGAFVAEHWGWRHALGMVAVPGLLLSFCALGLKDFKTAVEPAAESTGEKEPYIKVLSGLLCTPTLLCSYFAAAMTLLVSGTMQSWLPTYFARVANFPLTTASAIAAATLSSAAIALVYAGPLVDWLRKKNPAVPPIWMASTYLFVGLVLVWAFQFATPGSTGQIIALTLYGIIGGSGGTVGALIVVDIAHPGYRGSAISLMVMIQNILGYGVGPILTGMLSDWLGLASAISAVCGAMFIAGGLMTICIFTYQKDLAKVSNVKPEF